MAAKVENPENWNRGGGGLVNMIQNGKSSLPDRFHARSSSLRVHGFNFSALESAEDFISFAQITRLIGFHNVDFLMQSD